MMNRLCTDPSKVRETFLPMPFSGNNLLQIYVPFKFHAERILRSAALSTRRYLTLDF